MFNASPDYSFEAQGQGYCHDCNEIVKPQWNGHEGVYDCPNCLAELENYSEYQNEQNKA